MSVCGDAQPRSQLASQPHLAILGDIKTHLCRFKEQHTLTLP